MNARSPLPANPAVGIVGATGLVGTMMLKLLEEREFPMQQVRFLASSFCWIRVTL